MFGLGKKKNQTVITEPKLVPFVCNFCGSNDLYVTRDTVLQYELQNLNTREFIDSDNLAFCGTCGKASKNPKRQNESANNEATE